MKAAEIARRYLEFFKGKDHAVIPSASLLYNDPTLLFVNAGMVPFKAYFTGAEAAPWKRAVSTQKCVRTLDIDEVGKTTRHGTFFQMNGNFSFGDYFKKETIEWAWELVTTEQHNGGLGFDPDSVWVTVLGPGHHPGYPGGDVEAAEIWQSLGVPADRIQRRGLKDNYWHMGVPGPGGPCSEIYIDRGPEYGPEGGPLVDEDRFLEIWNLVFQTEELSVVRQKDDFDIARQLPSRNIDTGMGVERVAYLLQGVDNMYEIDQIFPVIERAAHLAGRRYGDNHDDDVHLRVVGDHVRSGLMLLPDGVTPGNEGRGYVLRRLLRRSIRSMRQLGFKDPSLLELMDISRSLMSPTYPEIDEQWERIQQVAEAEEDSFRRTLTAGIQLFDKAVHDTVVSGAKTLAGDKAFALHDTYGFPIDLTLEMASEEGLSVDESKFRELMDEQRARAKADSRAKKGGTVSTEAYTQLRSKGETQFRGYTALEVPTRVRGIVSEGVAVARVEPGQQAEIILEETPFYAEAGGQTADTGVIRTPDGELEVLDVQRPVPGLTVHKVRVSSPLEVGADVLAEVDAAHRRAACQAHSATHLLQASLRELVGPTATQAGSFNKPGYLRFDFSAQQGLSSALVREIEQRVNVAINDDLTTTATVMSLDEAKAFGAVAMFGEKYPPMVRVIEMGGPWSRELCGGTHVQSSAQIGLFTLLAEQSIGAGTRRVEALVSTDAFNHLAAERTLVSQLSTALKTQPEQLVDRVEKMVADLKSAEKQIAELKSRQLLAGAGELVDGAKDMWGLAFVARKLDGVNGNDLRTLALDVRERFGARPAVVALIGGTDAKPSLLVATNAAARERGCRAGALVAAGSEKLGGRGGGRDDLAQGGGTDGGAAGAALQAVEYAVGHAILN